MIVCATIQWRKAAGLTTTKFTTKNGRNPVYCVNNYIWWNTESLVFVFLNKFSTASNKVSNWEGSYFTFFWYSYIFTPSSCDLIFHVIVYCSWLLYLAYYSIEHVLRSNSHYCWKMQNVWSISFIDFYCTVEVYG